MSARVRRDDNGQSGGGRKRTKPAAIEDEVAPAGVSETNRVDKGGEEVGETAKQLEEGDAARTEGIGPEFDKVRVGQGVVTNVVGW